MTPKTRLHWPRLVFALVTLGLGCWWLYDASTCGYCTVSRTVGPVVVLINLAFSIHTVYRLTRPPKT